MKTNVSAACDAQISAYAGRSKYATDHEEYEIGNRCIAAPIYDYCGEIVAAISASGSTIQIPDEKIPEIAEGVMQIAHEISRGLGYTG